MSAPGETKREAEKDREIERLRAEVIALRGYLDDYARQVESALRTIRAIEGKR